MALSATTRTGVGSSSRLGRTWAEIGRLVGQRKLSVTADTYTHVLSDGAEISLEQLLAR